MTWLSTEKNARISEFSMGLWGLNTKINCISKDYQQIIIYNKTQKHEVLNNMCKIFNTENYKILLRKT